MDIFAEALRGILKSLEPQEPSKGWLLSFLWKLCSKRVAFGIEIGPNGKLVNPRWLRLSQDGATASRIILKGCKAPI